MKNLIKIIILLYSSFITSQSVEVTNFNQNPLEVSPLLGADLTINFKYTSQSGSSGHNIYIGLEELDSNNEFVKTISGKSLTNQQAGTDVQKSVNLFVGSINPVTTDLPTGHYYQALIRLYDNNWNELSAATYLDTPPLVVQESNYNFSSKIIAKGADISWMTEMEDQGFTWKDNDGNTKELMPLLKEYDLDAVRLRVWVNPDISGANGWCDIDDLVIKAEKAKVNNLDIMISVHYSDWWADPGQQTKPAAWTNYSIAQLETAVANHTTAILTALDAKGITPKWIQIGNETNDGMLWTTGKASNGGFSNYAKFINAGSNAVKNFNSSIKTILHIASGNDNALYQWNIGGLINNGLQINKIDIIGMSLYPDENNWKTYVDDSYNNMVDLKSRYNKEVMMAEIGFSNNRPDITYQLITYMIEKTKQTDGLGVFYWEPIARSPFTSYSKGAWDDDGSPSPAMDAFIDRSTLSTENFENTTEGFFKVYPNPSSKTIRIGNSKDILNSIIIYDLKGSMIKSIKAEGLSKTIDISNLKAGLYFIKINNTKSVKFLKN